MLTNCHEKGSAGVRGMNQQDQDGAAMPQQCRQQPAPPAARLNGWAGNPGAPPGDALQLQEPVHSATVALGPLRWSVLPFTK